METAVNQERGKGQVSECDGKEVSGEAPNRINRE